MAVGNQLRKAAPQQQSDQIVEYKANGMNVKLTPSMVRNYLVSGDKERVTMPEVAMFINLCKFSGLNPWLKEAYCIKYGNEPATMVVGKEAFLKRAEANPYFDGSEAGIIVLDNDTGEILYRKGTVKLPGEEIIGGYAEVWRKDRSHSIRSEVSFDEYAGRKKDGSLNSQWGKKPATMIRKVALVQALREAFPTLLGGMYTAEEQGKDEPEEFVAAMPEQPAEAPTTPTEPERIETREPVQQPAFVQREQPVQEDIGAALFGA